MYVSIYVSKHLKRHQKPVVFKHRILIVIYFFHLFLYIPKFPYLIIYIYIYNIHMYVYYIYHIYIYMFIIYILYILYTYVYIIHITYIYMWVFFHEHSRLTRQQGKVEAISLTSLCHLNPLHRHFKLGNYCRELTSAHS